MVQRPVYEVTMSEFGGRRFQRRSFCVQEDSSHSSCNTLFVLDSHSKAIDMDQVEKKLGGVIFHEAGPDKAFTPRGGHERRSYLSTDRWFYNTFGKIS